MKIFERHGGAAQNKNFGALTEKLPALYPDYGNMLYSNTGVSDPIVVSENCWYQYLQLASKDTAQMHIHVNDNDATIVNFVGSVFAFMSSGFLKKGDVVKLTGGKFIAYKLR